MTDITVRSLPIPPKGQVTYWDQKMPGFGCRVSQGGQKTFVVMHGPREARARKIVGKYPIQSLKIAREEAKKKLAGVALGIIQQPVRGAIQFVEARDRYLEHARLTTRPRTAACYERLLKKHFPFGKKKITEITKQDLQYCLAKLHHVPSEQAHAKTAARIFFNWVYREELIDRNPADRLPRMKKRPPRERVLSELEAGEVYKKAQKFKWPYGPIVQLCLLMGQRPGEVGALEWEWINLEELIITLPGERVKNGRTHKFPIGDVAVDLLKNLPRIDEYVFSGRNKANATFNGWAKSKREFDATLQNVAPYTLHDLRRTFSTFHAKLGTPIHVTERLLNHVSGSISGVAAIYNRHTYLPEMRDAVEKYEDHLSSILR